MAGPMRGEAGGRQRSPACVQKVASSGAREPSPWTLCPSDHRLHPMASDTIAFERPCVWLRASHVRTCRCRPLAQPLC